MKRLYAYICIFSIASNSYTVGIKSIKQAAIAPFRVGAEKFNSLQADRRNNRYFEMGNIVSNEYKFPKHRMPDYWEHPTTIKGKAKIVANKVLDKAKTVGNFVKGVGAGIAHPFKSAANTIKKYSSNKNKLSSQIKRERISFTNPLYDEKITAKNIQDSHYEFPRLKKEEPLYAVPESHNSESVVTIDSLKQLPEYKNLLSREKIN
jgi:hypothetical protein